MITQKKIQGERTAYPKNCHNMAQVTHKPGVHGSFLLDMPLLISLYLPVAPLHLQRWCWESMPGTMNPLSIWDMVEIPISVWRWHAYMVLSSEMLGIKFDDPPFKYSVSCNLNFYCKWHLHTPWILIDLSTVHILGNCTIQLNFVQTHNRVLSTC